MEPLRADVHLPLVVRPALPGLKLRGWMSDHRGLVEEKLLDHGALLFRDFPVRSIEAFEEVAIALSGELVEYRFRASPRTTVKDRIYTSTDYPPEQSIFPHNEHSYSPVFPLRLYFFCETPASKGGETPVGDTRRVLERIDADVRQRFEKNKILYVRNYGDGFGLSWQTVFQAEDPAQVEAYCRAQGIAYEWKGNGRLRTRQVGPAIVRHPRTGERIWFNHATFFHVTTLPKELRESLLDQFTEEDLPNHTFYGDGSPIEPDVVEHLRGAYRDVLIEFSWQRGDILLVDNMLAVHSRNPYEGPRKIVVAMAEAFASRDLTN
jgi:alpha-ketoglutarate-dependent taurine dioxygenase